MVISSTLKKTVLYVAAAGVAGVIIPHALFHWMPLDVARSDLSAFAARASWRIMFPYAIFMDDNVQARELLEDQVMQLSLINGATYALVAGAAWVASRISPRMRMLMLIMGIAWVALGMGCASIGM